MSGHTPGPWRVFTPENYEGPNHLPGLGVEAVTGEAVVWYADQPESGLANDADARLIAAAPTMLVDVRAALAVCDRIVRDYGAVECGVDFSALQARLRATIATATAAESHARVLLAASAQEPTR